MATFNKYNDFVEQLGLEQHNLSTDVFKVALFKSTHTPSATDTTYSSTNEVTNGGGYTTGGEDAQLSYTETGGTGTVTGVDIVWTATGPVSDIKHAVLYNTTNNKLVCYWTRDQAVTLATGETFTVDFGTSVFTLA